MTSQTARLTFRVVLIALALIVLFCMGRPLYWKISATVQQGLSQIVLEAKRTVGWYHDESDSGAREDGIMKKVATARRLLLNQEAPAKLTIAVKQRLQGSANPLKDSFFDGHMSAF